MSEALRHTGAKHRSTTERIPEMKAALLLALLAFASIAIANPAPEEPPQFVYSAHSAPGESMDDFALRIAHAAIDH